MSAVVVVPTGTCNLASVRAAFARLGAETTVTADPGRIRTAARVVLPGVGTFGAAMAALRAAGADEALRERIERDRPLLAICVGMQVLARSSDENPGVAGLGALAERVTALAPRPGVRVPHMGWNRIEPERDDDPAPAGRAYFAHSFALRSAPPDWSAARCTHDAPFVAAVRRGAVLGCQFHPELSGAYGRDLLARFAQETVPC